MSKKKDEVKAQYGRVKGAPWFPLLHKKDIMVLGQGGIGSWTSLLLSRLGCNLHLYDMDRYEEHNMTGQVVKASDLGKLKTEAMRDVIKEMSPDCDVEIYGRYEVGGMTNPIMICGFDNMLARKIAFTEWKQQQIKVYPEKARECFFQDGRLLAEHYQIFSIPGDRPDLMEIYEKEWLFDDSEVKEAECTFKQTSHCAAKIAATMVEFLTNWVTNAYAEEPYRLLPFKHEHIIPVNYTVNDYARVQECVSES